jgi:hypothetical protein
MARQKTSEELFVYEARKEGRVVALLRGVAGANGTVTVETEVYPVTGHASTEPQKRPFSFRAVDQARHFVDETLLALEYLGCTVVE